jgi:hypothetical protein
MMFALAALVAACDDAPSSAPTGPSTIGPSVSALEIIGPDTLAPGQSVQYSASLRLSDGSTRTASPTEVRWGSNASYVTWDAAGLVTARQLLGETDLNAEVGPLNVRDAIRGSKRIVIVPEGTFRMTGAVTEAGSPGMSIPNARIEVTPGSLAVTTGFDGQYKLYGVPSEADVRITVDGYAPFAERVQLAAHATRDFQMTLPGPRLSLAGNYTLAIDVVNQCSGAPGLPTDLQHRRYDAVVTQDGFVLDVTLTEPKFRINSAGRGNRFRGQASATGAAFTLEWWEPSDSATYPEVVERLTDGTFLSVFGRVLTTGSARGLSGQMIGGSGIELWDAGFPTAPVFLGGCFLLSPLQFALTPR